MKKRLILLIAATLVFVIAIVSLCIGLGNKNGDNNDIDRSGNFIENQDTDNDNNQNSDVGDTDADNDNNQNSDAGDTDADNQDADIDGDFVDNQVLFVLTHEETLKFLDYTLEDFADVGAIAIEELTAGTVDWVRKKVLGIPTDREMLVDIDNYCRIFCITLNKHSKANVLKVAEILSQRDGIQAAEPNYILSLA